MSKEEDNDVFVVSSNNERQVPPKNNKFWGIFEYKISFKKI